MRHEGEPIPFPTSGEPLHPSPLPPELAEFLEDKLFACVTMGTDQGTVLVVKAPAQDIRSVRGRVPMHVRHELYRHAAAPVIRSVVTIYDQPDRPLAFETFTNVGDPQQRADFAALANQRELLLLFYDEELRHVLSKRVRNTPRASEMTELVLDEATTVAAAIPHDQFDFDRAKADVMKQTQL